LFYETFSFIAQSLWSLTVTPQIHLIIICFCSTSTYFNKKDVWSPTTPTEHVRSLGRFEDRTNEEHKEETIVWVNAKIWVWVGAPWVHDGDVRHQGGTHLTFLIMIDRYLGFVWERAGKIGIMPKDWTRLPLTIWVHQRGWITPSTHPRGVTMIDTREFLRKGVCTQESGVSFQEKWRLMGTRVFQSYPIVVESHDKYLSTKFSKKISTFFL
jgi:hypothetical protein